MALSAGTRRTVACLLVGLGALLIVAALMIPTYTVGKLAKTPLDLEITTIATNQPGEDSLVLDSKSLTAPEGSAKVDTNVPLVSQRFLTVEEPADAEKMTVQAGQTLRRIDKQGDTGLLTAAIDRVTIDRVTGMPIDTEPNGSIAVTTTKQGESIADPVQHTGLQYRFPIGTEKKTYPYFDLNVRKTFDANFIEETEINSMKVYHFQMSVPATSLWDVVQAPTNRLSLPAAKWGVEGGDSPVTMTRYYTNTRDLWVEPQTGTVVKGGEQLHLYYSRTADKPEVTALKSHIVFDENTVESQIAVAKKNIDKLSLYGRILPIVLGVLGVIALIAGVFLGVRGGSAPVPARSGGAPGRRPSGGAAPRRVGGHGADDAPTEQIRIQKQP
ncbi:porin PorA family protein [Nocardia sp. R6R-6]|uniref:porin PorA family protein n=1 Tax=Nocardia sp. R6R-6 TaxID=3459303 RepID=UPI00403E104A